jgi:curved DNA-binding protein CbpA
MDNPYEVFDLPPDADQKVIAERYKELVKKHHPDSGGTPEMFNKIMQSANILRDPSRRREYDEQGFSDEPRPDSIQSFAMERVCRFFIDSIEATINTNQNLDDFDLITGANAFFDQAIQQTEIQILNTKKRIKQYEKAIKKLRTKRKKDLIKNMLTNHIAGLRQGMANSEHQIKISKKAIEIIKDYEFKNEEKLFRLMEPDGSTLWIKL